MIDDNDDFLDNYPDLHGILTGLSLLVGSICMKAGIELVSEIGLTLGSGIAVGIGIGGLSAFGLCVAQYIKWEITGDSRIARPLIKKTASLFRRERNDDNLEEISSQTINNQIKRTDEKKLEIINELKFTVSKIENNRNVEKNITRIREQLNELENSMNDNQEERHGMDI